MLGAGLSSCGDGRTPRKIHIATNIAAVIADIFIGRECIGD